MGRHRTHVEPTRNVILGQFQVNGGASTNATHSFSPGYSNITDEIHPNHPFSGGPLCVLKRSIKFDYASGWAGYDYMWRPNLQSPTQHLYTKYTGKWRVNQVHIDSLRIPFAVDNSVNTYQYGAEAWNKFKPRPELADMGQFFGELKEVPSLVRLKVYKHLIRHKKIGDAYLTGAFGWKPFASDLLKWYKSIDKMDKYLSRLVRTNGKWQKRRGVVFSNTTSTGKTQCSSYGTVNPSSVTPNGSVALTGSACDFTCTTTDKCWFKGSMRYYVPALEQNNWGGFQAYRYMYGLRLTPALVWNLTPWSWLAGWFANVGDVVSNYSSQLTDQLVARYAYLMRTTESTYQLTQNFTAPQTTRIFTSPTYVPYSTSATVVLTSKVRVVGNPFALSPPSIESLTPFRLSILSALGMKYL